MAFAGLDVGTSSSKILVFDLDGRVLFKASRTYAELGEEGRRELKPDVVMENVRKVLREAAKNSPEKIEALAVASLGESVVCLDEENRPLANSMLTGDSRGIEETRELVESAGADEIFRITGLPPNELYGLPKYMWLNRSADAVRKAKAILFYEDYVGYMLTGKRVVSYSSAARSLAFDIRKKEWSRKLLDFAGIRPDQMSEPAPSGTVIGTVLAEVSEELGLEPDMKVVVGGHDQSCAALGSGLCTAERGECGMGTCEFMFAMLPKAVMSPYMMENDFTCIPYMLPETYLSSLEVTTCGALKNWARDGIFRGIREECRAAGRDFYAFMDQAAGDLKTDVLVLPQFGSSGNPDLSMDARGVICGLTIHTRPEEIYRALLEGMAFQMLLAYERVEKLGISLTQIAATGGGAASELTLRIRADVFGMEVLALENDESGALGCMILAAYGAGAYESLEQGIGRAVRVRKVFRPDPGMRSYYEKKFEKYKKLYELMHDFK